MERIDKINYYLEIADTVTKRGTCLRRNYGAIIVKLCKTKTKYSIWSKI